MSASTPWVRPPGTAPPRIELARSLGMADAELEPFAFEHPERDAARRAPA